MDAPPQQGLGHGQMGGRRYHDGDGIDLAGNVLQTGKDRATRLLGHGPGPFWIRIHDPHQGHIGQAGVDEGVKAAQITHANDGETQFVSHAVSLWKRW